MSYLFDMMSDQLVGTRVVDLNAAPRPVRWSVGDAVHVYGFEASDRAVLYRPAQRPGTGAGSRSAWRGDGAAPTVAVTRSPSTTPRPRATSRVRRWRRRSIPSAGSRTMRTRS
ncbi:MAG: hypothetical protein R3D80_03265 [Paracoccaceae bacterium]